MATVTSLYICISYIYTYSYNFNYLSSLHSYCMSIFFLLHVLCLWHISLSILFLYSYTYHVFIFHACHMSFSMFLFFSRLHIMSLVYVFFICPFYDLLHSMYYYVYHIIPYLSHILCLFLVTCLYRILNLFHLISYIMFFASFLYFHVSYTFI